MFKLESKNSSIRKGKLRTKSGVINTPFFMPVATKGAVKHIGTDEIIKIGYQVILGNTYHLWLRPGDKLIKKSKGLHTFMNWDDSILTDSGGFQVFSLGQRAKERFGVSGVKLTEKGVEFADHLNGSSHFLSPEKSIDIQCNLGSDMIMCLDECPSYPCKHEVAQRSLGLTTRWAERCHKHFHDKAQKKKTKQSPDRPLLFGIVQGSTFEDLRKRSAREITKIDFDGFAIGGVAVGEPREKLHEILKWVVPLLPKDKPRYLMGLGKPEEIVAAVFVGVDMFDCVIPTREGRHGRVFVWNEGARRQTPKKLLDLGGNFYSSINITNRKFQQDLDPIDKKCGCYACTNYSKAYIRYLFSVGEMLGQRLTSLHNLTFYFELMEKLKEE